MDFSVANVTPSLHLRCLANLLLPPPAAAPPPGTVFIDLTITRGDIEAGDGRGFRRKRASKFCTAPTYFRHGRLVGRYGNNSARFASSQTMASQRRASRPALCAFAKERLGEAKRLRNVISPFPSINIHVDS